MDGISILYTVYVSLTTIQIYKPSIISGAFYFHKELRGVGVSEPLGEERYKKGYTHCNLKSPDLTHIFFWKYFVSLDVIFKVRQIKEIQ